MVYAKWRASMGYNVFSAIEVGSSELSMKIYEISKEKGIKELEYIRKTVELGAETYVNNKISHDKIKTICKILIEFKRKMKEYGIHSYKAFATSAIREATNSITVLDRIKVTTGIDVKILSNSEKRFLYYKAIAMHDKEFNDIIDEGTAIVDVGAGSIQISLYDKGMLLSTQNIKLGFLRIEKIIGEIDYRSKKHIKLVEEYINNDLNTYKKLFLDKEKVKNIIAVGDNIDDFSNLCLYNKKTDYLTKEAYDNIFLDLININDNVLKKKNKYHENISEFIVPTALIYKKIFSITNANKVWFPKVAINDGIVVDYAENHRIIKKKHDFDADIIYAARKLGQRYKCNIKHAQNVENSALCLYDRLKKIHGLGQRERLYTQIATILHNCGTYINMNEVPINSYNIVMSTELIGLSHMERSLVANMVKYMSYDLPDYDVFASVFDKQTYIVMSKIIAILRLANAMDKSHRQKCKKIDIILEDNNMIVNIDTIADITLEKKAFLHETDFFMELYGVKPKLKQKHKNN